MARKTISELLGAARFGKLEVIGEAEGVPAKGGGVMRRALCRCDCGDVRQYYLGNLRRGASSSCGCARGEAVQRARTTHWHGGGNADPVSPEYRVWAHMIGRCHNPEDRSYANYGGRGITVCPEWRESFESFLRDVGPRPSPRHQIDRLDNDGPYSPGNCAWRTFREQCRNKRTNRWMEFRGERMCITDAARMVGIDRRTIAKRLDLGWSDERALTTPVR